DSLRGGADSVEAVLKAADLRGHCVLGFFGSARNRINPLCDRIDLRARIRSREKAGSRARLACGLSRIFRRSGGRRVPQGLNPNAYFFLEPAVFLRLLFTALALRSFMTP